MIPVLRILVASSIAPLGAAIPVSLLGFFAWSYAIHGPFAKSEVSVVMPLTFALVSVLPIYVGLAVGFLATSLLLRVIERLTRNAMFAVSAVVSLAIGLWLGGNGLSVSPLWETTTNVLIQFLISFAFLAGVSVLWWRLAAGRTRYISNEGRAGEA